LRAEKGCWPMSNLKRLNTPVFWAEGHPGALDRDEWEIQVSGLCKSPRTFAWADLLGMAKTIADARLTSVTRFSVRGLWGGVRVGSILETVAAEPAVTYVRFWSFRGIYDTSVPIDVALAQKTLLAYEFDGELLEEDYGGPVRVFCPYLWGYKSAKSVVGIELMDHYLSGFWEKRGYTDHGRIESGKVRDLNKGGRVRPIPDGEVVRFLDD
jgi:methionine sulfoxide reductase catalytic subunit